MQPTRLASRRGKRALGILLLLLVLAPAGVADEGKADEPRQDEYHVLVLTAYKRGHSKELARLATAAGQGVWFIVEHLGQVPEGNAAALAFVAQWQDADRAALLRYIHGRKGKTHSPEAMRALQEARQAIKSRLSSSVDLLLGASDFDEETVFGMWVLDVRASMLRTTDRADEALLAYLEGADIAERIGWRAHAAELLRRAAGVASMERDFGGEREAWERRYNLLRSRGDLKSAASCKANTATACANMEDFGRARRLYNEAIAELEQVHAKRNAALTRANLGLLHLRLGELERALTGLETALATLGEVGTPPDQAEAMSNLASVRYALGQEDKSRALNTQAVAVMRKHLDTQGGLTLDETYILAMVVGNCGNDHMVAGDYEAAGERLSEARDIFESKLRNTHGVAIAMVNLAELALRKADLVGASVMIRGALEHFEHLGDESQMAQHELMRGRILVARKKFAEAEASFARAQDAGQRLRLYAVVVDAMTERASLALARKDYEAASDLAFGAVDLLGSSLAHLADTEGADAREGRLRTYQLPIRVAMATGDAAACAEAMDLARAGSFLEVMGGRAALREHALADDLRERIDGARARESKAWEDHRRAQRGRSRPRKQAADRRLTSAHKVTSAVHDSIQRSARRGADLVYPRADELEDIQADLEPTDALVLYALLAEKSVALVITHDEKHIRPLGPEADIRAACDALLLKKAPFLDPTKAAALTKEIVTPLKLGPGVKRVLISPDGVLTYVPFALLLPKLALAYVPSGTAYRALRMGSEERGKGIVALGDPLYNERADARRVAVYRGPFGGRLPRLKASGDEVRAIGKGETVFTRAAANEANLRKAVRPRRKHKRLRSLHLAGHGMANAEHPQLSCIALTPSGADDGYLLAREVMGMQIPTDLVVLSACESVRGKVVRGEGLQGLTRAFMFAGASAVLASLWNVDDEATKVFMVKFYSLWNPPKPPKVNKKAKKAPKSKGPKGTAAKAQVKPRSAADALRETQEFMRTKTKWKEPKHWAAWVLWGLPD